MISSPAPAVPKPRAPNSTVLWLAALAGYLSCWWTQACSTPLFLVDQLVPMRSEHTTHCTGRRSVRFFLLDILQGHGGFGGESGFEYPCAAKNPAQDELFIH